MAEPDRNIIQLRNATKLDLVVLRLLGLGLPGELIVDAIASRFRRISGIQDLRKLNAPERVAAIRARFLPVETEFLTRLDVIEEWDWPYFNWKTVKSETSLALFVEGIVEDERVASAVEGVLKTAISIKRAEDSWPKLNDTSAQYWLSRLSWTIREFAALSLGRIPVLDGKAIPKCPVGSSIASQVENYKDRCDQFARAAALTEAPLKLSSSTTPNDAIKWAKSNRFSVHRLLQPRAAAVYALSDFSAFRAMCVSKLNELAKDTLKLRRDPLLDLFSDLFPRAELDDYLDYVWKPLGSSGAAKSGNISDKYQAEWRPVREAIVSAWKDRN